MAKRDVLLRLSKDQAEALLHACADVLDGQRNIAVMTDPVQQRLHIARMKLTKVLERHEQKEAGNG